MAHRAAFNRLLITHARRRKAAERAHTPPAYTIHTRARQSTAAQHGEAARRVRASTVQCANAFFSNLTGGMTHVHTRAKRCSLLECARLTDRAPCVRSALPGRERGEKRSEGI